MSWNRALEKGGRLSHVKQGIRLRESYDAALARQKIPVNKTCRLLPRRSTNGRCLSTSPSPPTGNLPAAVPFKTSLTLTFTTASTCRRHELHGAPRPCHRGDALREHRHEQAQLVRDPVGRLVSLD